MDEPEIVTDKGHAVTPRPAAAHSPLCQGWSTTLNCKGPATGLPDPSDTAIVTAAGDSFLKYNVPTGCVPEQPAASRQAVSRSPKLTAEGCEEPLVRGSFDPRSVSLTRPTWRWLPGLTGTAISRSRIL